MKDINAQIKKNGYVVLENYFTSEEADEMKKCGEELTNNLPPENLRKIFSTVESEQNKETYFIDSANKISYFFEKDALEDNGKLKVDPRVALNKVGHALGWLHPTFKRVTFDERIKEVAYQLDFQEPAVCQSMYIFKNPGLGSEVTVHQDATYLYTDPSKVLGFWIALDDATMNNGCLWIAPGSHKSGVHRRFMKNPNPNSTELLIYDKPEPCYQLNNFVAVPVKKGSCVILDGQVVHYSKANKSDESRHAYTFHVVETKYVTYSKENWLQPPPNGFPLLYRN